MKLGSKPFLIIMAVIVFFVWSVLMILSGYKMFKIDNPSVPGIPVKSVSSLELWNLVNDWRMKNGISSLKEDLKLCSIASTRVFEIQTDWSHNKAPNFENYFVDLKEYKTIGENLSRDYTSSEETFAGWLGSPGHKANIEGNYSHSCVKCLNNYCVQIFANFK